MSDKEKTKVAQPKNIPKDGQVIMSIMKEMGITEYEPKTLIQLTEFVYKYTTSVLEEARMFANNSKQKFLDLDDVRLALQLANESTFTTPPPREVVLECARNKNNSPLPAVKPHCGLRLPPDRHCLNACNYTLKSSNPKKTSKATFSVGSAPSIKLATKPGVSYIKRANPIGITKQTVTIPKPVTKVSSNANIQSQKTVLKPKIQISQVTTSANGTTSTPMEVDNSLKRKREDEGET